MAKSAAAAIATDSSTDNDQYIKNDSGCCIFAPTPESAPVKVVVSCVTGCEESPTNSCGLTHPAGSGTLAGCKSTTLPHFGVIMNKRTGKCRQFGYYTSGNKTEYENECGELDVLSYVAAVPPAVNGTYTATTAP